MQSFGLFVAVLCVLEVKSQRVFEVKSDPSYLPLPVSAVLPQDHVCRRLYDDSTIVMVPNPAQTHSFKRHPPTGGIELQKAINESGANSLRDLGPFSSPYCSDKIVTLVCFFYFPVTGLQAGELLPPVFPCRSLCEELTDPNSTCSQRTGSNWGNFYNYCNFTYFSGGDAWNREAGYRDVYTESDYCASGTLATTLKPIPTASTLPPCPDELPEGTDKTSKCRERNTKIFDKIQTEKYKSSYVLNCTIRSMHLDGDGILKKRAIKCHVNDFYGGLAGGDTCGCNLSAGSEVDVLGYPTSCTNKRGTSVYQLSDTLSVGDNVCIAGKYCTEYCGKTYLFLTHRDILSTDSCPTYERQTCGL